MVDTWPLILLIEDDPAVRRALERALPLRKFNVICVSDGLEGLTVLAETPPDVIVLDVGLPGPDGIGLTQRLRDDGNAVPILLLTARSTVDDRVAGLDAGADDYLTKPFALDELVARVHALLRRRAPQQSAKRLRLDQVVLDETSHTVEQDGEPIAVTPIEFQILATLLASPKRIFTREQLAAVVWHEPHNNPNRLEQHIAGIRRKLETDGAPRIIHTVRGVGYVARR